MLGAKVRRAGRQAVERASDVGLEHTGPIRGGQSPQGAVMGDPGIVDEMMDRAEVPDHIGNEALDLHPITHVTAGGIDLNAE